MSKSKEKEQKPRGRAKGTIGDLSRYKITTILMALAILVLIILIVLYGIHRYGSRRNIFSLLAILSVLPFAKECSILAALLPYRTLSGEKAAELFAAAADMEVIYDIIFATKKRVYPIGCMVIEEGMALVYTSVEGDKQKELQDELKSFFKGQGQSRFAVKIETDYGRFKEMFDAAARVQHQSRTTHILAENLLANCV